MRDWASDNSALDDAASQRPSERWVIASPPMIPRPPFTFSTDDDRFLDEVARSSFLYLWCEADPKTGMVHDRTSVKFVSTAGVGFQLAAIPVAVERGWITREQGQARALTIVRALAGEPSNRKAGLFYHFIDGTTARPIDNDVVSTIDSAILFAGLMVASSYFGAEIAQVSDALVAAANWTFFVENNPPAHEPHMKGFISLGWKPTTFTDPTGAGTLLPYFWADSGDEHRLVKYLAVAAPNPEHALGPQEYYRLRRPLGWYGEVDGQRKAHVWFPWSGALFTNFFASCFVDYAARGADDPAAFGVLRRARVDWWENGRRAVAMHRQKAMVNPLKLPTFGENAWGLSASDDAKGYAVPGVFPNPIRVMGDLADVDFADVAVKDNYGDGTLGPYAAGCAIMFEPEAAVRALRYYRSLTDSAGKPLVWREPRRSGPTGPVCDQNYGFQDAFNLGTQWVAPDCVAIDQGPLVLAIENARSGLVWKLFESHPIAQAAAKRLGWTVRPR